MSSSKLSKAFKSIANIDIFDPITGQLRDTYSILEDMAKVFPTLTVNQRQYLAEMASGKRQVNVLQSILQNWSGVEKATKAAENSTGSAIRENIKYLNSIEGKMNAVESAWEKLSQKTIDDNLIKGWYDFSKTFIDLQSSIGGVIPLLGVLAALFSKQLATGITVVNEKIKTMTSTVTTASKGFKALRLSIAGIAIALSIYTAITGKIRENAKAAAEARQETIDYGDSLGQTALDAESLYTKLNNLYSIENRTEDQESELLNLNSDLVSILGDRAKALEGLTVGTNEYRDALEKLLAQEAEMNTLALRNAVLDAQEALETDIEKRKFVNWQNPYRSGGLFAVDEKDFSGVEDLFSKIQEIIFESTDSIKWGIAAFTKEISGITLEPIDKSSEGLLRYYNSLLEIEKATDDTRTALMASNDEKDKELANNLYLSDSYKDLEYEISRYEEKVQDLLKAQILEYVNDSRKNRQIPQTVAEYETFRKAVVDYLGVSGELAEDAGELADSLFPALSGSVADSSWALDEANKTIQEAIGEFDDLMDKIDSIQSAYKVLSNAVDEYKTSGKLSLDTVQELLSLSDEQINALNTESGELELNKKALEELTKARLNELKASAINTAYARIQALITEKELKQDLTEETQAYTYAELVQLATENALGEQGDIILQALKSRIGFIDELIAGTGLLSTVESEEAKSALDILDDIQSVYSTFTEATKEYAKTGGFSFDTLQKILSLSPEYLKFLFDENGQISLNTETLKRYQDQIVQSLSDELWESHRAKLEEVTKQEEEGNITTEEAIEKREELTLQYLDAQAVIDAYIATLGDEKSALEEAQQAVEDANSALDEATSAYDTLKDAVKEYNKTGVLSVDTFQALMNLSPEFLAMFFNQATAVGNAEAAINAQVESLKQAKIESLAAAAAEQILAVSESAAGNAASSATGGMGSFSSSASNMGAAALDSAGDIGVLQTAVYNLQKQLGSDVNIDWANEQIAGIVSNFQNIASQIRNIGVSFTSSGGSGGGGGGGSSTVSDQAEAIADAYDSLLSYTMKMLKQETEDRIDQLEDELDVEEELYEAEKERIEDQIDGYEEIIDKKKESLKLDKEEKDYNDTISELNKEISDIQNELLELQFDTSESAAANRLELEEELADKQKDLADEQYDRSIDLTEQALDDEFDLYESEKEAEIDVLDEAFEATKLDYENRINLLKQYLEEENTIRTESMALIEAKTAEFYERLFEWNTKYGDLTKATLQSLIDTSQQTVTPTTSSKRYKTTYKIISDDTGEQINSGYGVGSTKYQSQAAAKSLAAKKIVENSHAEYGKTQSYHKGLDAGFVGNLKGNEEFVKALKGEAFITPKQINDYMNNHLPNMLATASSGNSIQCDNLLSINVSGNIDSSSIGKLQQTVTTQFDRLNKILNGNGVIRKANDFA